MNKYNLILISCLLFACSKSTDHQIFTASQTLNNLFVDIENFETKPEQLLWRGQHPKNKWEPLNENTLKLEADSLNYFIEQIMAVDDKALSKQELISKQVMLIKLRNSAAEIKYKMYYIPFNAEGGFYNRLAYSLSNLPFKTLENYQDYLAWLPYYHNRLLENLSLIKKGVNEGVIAPKIIVQNTINLLKPWVKDDYKDLPYYAPLLKIPIEIDETEHQFLIQKADSIISAIGMTYHELNEYFSTTYLAAAKDVPGISSVPNGKAYYENRVEHYTTLPLSPDSVHNLGLAEVKRIRVSMEEIIQELKYDGTYRDFLDYLRTDEQFFAKTPQELLNYAAWLSKKAEGELPKFFNSLYSLPFTVKPVPEAIAPTYTTGRYSGGSWENKKAGEYWVNTYNLPSRTLYTMPALTLHEAVPGHHLQGAFTAELKDLPAFRNNYYISAFGEGWGLYSEYLGEEMGMYTTPYELFGRYTYEMWRACRLVVDTGMHYKGWTRQQALDFMADNTALSIHEVTTEIDRYIGWPGQALSYKIGEIKIKALRNKAERELGDRFNIGEFHQAVLENGSVPLGVLEQAINEYIENRLTENIN